MPVIFFMLSDAEWIAVCPTALVERPIALLMPEITRRMPSRRLPMFSVASAVWLAILTSEATREALLNSPASMVALSARRLV